MQDLITSTLSSVLTQAYGPCRVPVPEKDSPQKSTKHPHGRKVDGRRFENTNNKDSLIQDGTQQPRDTSPVANSIADQPLDTVTMDKNDKAISKVRMYNFLEHVNFTNFRYSPHSLLPPPKKTTPPCPPLSRKYASGLTTVTVCWIFPSWREISAVAARMRGRWWSETLSHVTEQQVPWPIM